MSCFVHCMCNLLPRNSLLMGTTNQHHLEHQTPHRPSMPPRLGWALRKVAQLRSGLSLQASRIAGSGIKAWTEGKLQFLRQLLGDPRFSLWAQPGRITCLNGCLEQYITPQTMLTPVCGLHWALQKANGRVTATEQSAVQASLHLPNGTFTYLV